MDKGDRTALQPAIQFGSKRTAEMLPDTQTDLFPGMTTPEWKPLEEDCLVQAFQFGSSGKWPLVS
jgi:hypothetical protein